MLRSAFGGSLVLECGFRAMGERKEGDDLLPTKAIGELD